MPRTEERKKQFKVISVEITNLLDIKLKEIAKQKGISKSELVRNAINAYLK